MKHSPLIVRFTLFCILLLLCFTGCETQCTVCAQELPSLTEEDIAAAPAMLNIGGRDYAVTLEKRTRTSTDHSLYEQYTLSDPPADAVRPRIDIHAETGEITGFSGFRPFPAVAEIETLSDDALKTAVEGTLGDLFDFSVYNTFSAAHSPNNGGRHHYFLNWTTERDGMIYDNGITVNLTENGDIDYVHKSNAGPTELPESLQSEKTRTKKIEDALRDRLGRFSLRGIEYEIMNETLSFSHGMPCIAYGVKIIEDGFESVIVVVIQ